MDTANICNTGGRKINEDHLCVLTLTESKGCFAIADGLGGHSNGEIASALAVQTVKNSFSQHPEVSQVCLKQFFDQVQSNMARRAAEDVFYRSMRTTLAVLLLDGSAAVWAHVGDSRIYHFHDGTIQSVTPDHSVAYMAYQTGEISYQDIRNSPDQSRLFRSLGTEKEVKPEFGSAEHLEPGDAFLLCSDGFWELVTEKDMEKTLIKSSTASRWLAKMVRILNKNVPPANDHDNYSAITILL